MNKEKNLETILTISTGLIVIYLIFPEYKLLLIIAILLGVIGLFINPLSNKITWGWFKIAEIMGYFMSKILLTSVFYLFLFPIAILSRIFTKNNLQLKRTEDNTYYKTRNHKYVPKDIENVW